MNKLFLIVFFLLFFAGNLLQAQISYNFKSEYRYLKGSQAAGISSTWVTKSFDDSKWLKANSPFRFGDGTGGLLLSDMQNKYSTLYLRSKFTVVGIAELGDVSFNVDYDDGFILWINGKEALNSGGPAKPTSISLATSSHESGTPQLYSLSAQDLNLVEGENLIAVQVFNNSLESSDFYFDMQIAAQKVMPEVNDSLKVLFSKTAGFYPSAFDLTMSVPSNDYDLVYTIDGSNPQTSLTAIKGGKSKTITVNPTISTGRATTPGFIVRASLAKSGLMPSKPVTQTYLFMSAIKKQSYPGGGWPNGDVNGQWIDLEMDEKVTQSARYKNQIEGALLDIPSISIVTDLGSLFNPSTGIYVNAGEHGEEWERFCSVELIDSKNSTNQFNINAGLRIRGGWSRHGNYPKHAFRLFFKDEYGKGKLKFPLFGDEGADEFDKIDLRCEQNYAWSNVQDHNTFVREVFSRDTQRDMDQPYTRSRYYHLYLNGMYWGLYQTQERSEARFAETYFGGSKEDYDVIKVNTEDYNYRIEASDGNTDAWKEIWEACQNGFSSNEDYFALEGKNAKGVPEKGKEIKVDIDNLIDYMLTIFYTGNFDAPTTAFSGNTGPNNFYTINKRDDKTKGFIFFAHDSEHSMMIDAMSPGIGIEENRVEPWGLNVSEFSGFHPQWLHERLTSNAEYRQRFSDRVFKQFFNNGALTEDNCKKRFMKRADEVSMAVIAESARWGDAGSDRAKTKDDDWLPEIEALQNDFFPYRGEIVLQQLIDADLFTDLEPPLVRDGTKIVETEVRTMNEYYSLNLFDTEDNGLIYYTLDDSDPRLVGGNVNPTAINVASGERINMRGAAIVKCRIRRDNNWSPLRTVKILDDYEDFSNLKITELHYNPIDSIAGTDTISGKSFEFIEFKNLSKEGINLTGLKFASGINYKFEDNEVLLPGKFFVIASKPKWFFDRYGVVPSDGFDKSFSNEGEIVAIKDKNDNLALTFQYSIAEPWPQEPNGTGYSLCSWSVYPIERDPNEYSYWKTSYFINGSPFYDETGFPVKEPAIELVTDGLKIYPNPTRGMLFIKMNETLNGVQAELYTASGQKVMTDMLNQSSAIDLGRLNIKSGLLLLKITYNGETTVKRILYQK